METVLRCNVEVRVGLMSDFLAGRLKLEVDLEERVESDVLSCSTNSDRLKGILNAPRSLGYSEEIEKKLEKYSNTSAGGGVVQPDITEENAGMHRTRGQGVPAERSKAATVEEQRLESAWLQAVEKHTSGVRPEKNQIVPQAGGGQYHRKSSMATVVPSRNIDKDLSNGLKALKISESHGSQKGQNVGMENGFVISPSLLHRNNELANCDNESV